MILIKFLLLLFISQSAVSEDSDNDGFLSFNTSIDTNLNIGILIRKNDSISSQVTGYKVYYTLDEYIKDDQYKEWKVMEILTKEDSCRVSINGQENYITKSSVIRIRVSALFNSVESNPTSVQSIEAKSAAPKSPLIISASVLHNSTVLIRFVPPDNAAQVENYTISYKPIESDTWDELTFQSDFDSKIALEGLLSNETYQVKLFISGSSLIQGEVSNVLTFTTNASELPTVSIEPSEEVSVDPETSAPLSVKCTARSSTPSTVYWKVNDVRVSVDSFFYTVTTTIHDDSIESVIRAKSRTRSAKFSCVANNVAGDAHDDVDIIIKGPGSPPSEITLIAEKTGYTISWKPPSHPNGDITKYVVYHTTNHEDPLSDWKKIDLDGSEKYIKIICDTDDNFYVRVQAATELGPGIISDIVAIEHDAQPISVNLELASDISKGNTIVVADPNELISLNCTARGKPRPTLSVAITDNKNASLVEADVWHRLQPISIDGNVAGFHNFSVLTSKYVHCCARNSGGTNYSTVELRVDSPGDAPTNVNVVNVNALDATVVWNSPNFPNLPITSYIVLVNKDKYDDKSLWLQYESDAKETQVKKMILQTQNFEKSTIYYVCVRAKNPAGIGPISEISSFETLNGGPDGAPYDVNVFINEANQVILKWKAPNSSTQVTGYSLYYTRDLSLSNDDFKSWQIVELASDSRSFKFDYSVGLKPKTFYRVRIAGKNSYAEGPVSTTVEFETAYSELPIPTDLQTQVLEDNTVHIKFIAVRDPDDHSKAIDKYRIDLAATDDVMNAWWTTIKPSSINIDEVSSMIDIEISGDDIKRNQMYWVKIAPRLENPAWIVQSSKPRWFRTGYGKLITTAELSTPSKIEKEPNLSENLVFTCSGIGSPAPHISWKWNDAVIINATEGWAIINSIIDNNTIISKLSRNDIRESGVVECHATNNEGNATQTTELIVLGPGTAPIDIELAAYRNQINLTWNSPLITNGEILKYIVYYIDNQNYELADWQKFETADTSGDFDVFQENTEHFVRIQAVSERGPGIISDTFSCISDLTYEPIDIKIIADNIVDFEAEPNQNVQLKCQISGKPEPVLYYWFDEKMEQKVEELESIDYDVKEAQFPEINSKKNFTISCRGVNKYEDIIQSQVIMIKRPGEAPTNITWRFDADDDTLLYIDWSPIEHPNGDSIEYNLYLSNFKTKVSGPPVKIPEIPLNVNLSLRISAENEYGEGEKSFPIIIPTPNGGPKMAPILSSLHSQDNKLYLTWKKPKDTKGDIVLYTIYFGKVDDDEADWKKIEINGQETMAILDESVGLQLNEKYQLKMTSTNELNEGPATNVYSFELVSFDEKDLITNFTAILTPNNTVIVKLQDAVPYKSFNVYIRETDDQKFVKHVINIMDHHNNSQEEQNDSREINRDDKGNKNEVTQFSFHFQLDPSLRYKLKISGIRNGQEGPKSDEIDLIASQLSSDGNIQSTSSPRRDIVKEPPL